MTERWIINDGCYQPPNDCFIKVMFRNKRIDAGKAFKFWLTVPGLADYNILKWRPLSKIEITAFELGAL